ncbi:MAG: hypothetical protein D6814_16775 [Calditrichaeota bacterium]|nr:MAG: hypothetical protein D6814_16775 [Calditrichota bacterium]
MEVTTQAEKPEKAGPIGRLARAGLGLIFLYLLINFATGYSRVVQPATMVLYFWAFVGAYSHVLGTLIPPLRDKRRRLVTLLVLAILALLLDFLLYGSWWGQPLAVLLYGLALVAFGVLGIEFILSGALGYPGCESTVFHNLLHQRSAPRIEPCPLWDPIDRLEQRVFAKRPQQKGR